MSLVVLQEQDVTLPGVTSTPKKQNKKHIDNESLNPVFTPIDYSETTQRPSKTTQDYPVGTTQDHSEDLAGDHSRQASPDPENFSPLKRIYSLEGRVEPCGKVRDQLEGLSLDHLIGKSKKLGQNMEFVLARILVGLEESLGVSLNLEKTVSLWVSLQLRSNKDKEAFQKAFNDADTLIDEVERLYGYVQSGLKEKAVIRARNYSRSNKAKIFTIHPSVEKAFEKRLFHRYLVSACRYLAEENGDGTFFLSLIDAGKITLDKVDLDRKTYKDKGRSALKALERHGVIKRIKTGAKDEGASVYQYLLDDLTKPKEGPNG